MTATTTETATNKRVAATNALIVVDVQNDFCPGGSLPVEDGDKVAERIHRFVVEHNDEYKLIVATKCNHPDGWEAAEHGEFTHFSENPDYVNSWPPHCIKGTPGAQFHPNLNASAKNDGTTEWPPLEGQIELDLVFFKGMTAAAYSGFEGHSMPSANYDPPMGWCLDDYLKDKGVGHVDIVGLATDHCVKATALDAVKNGYDTSVLLSLTAGVALPTTANAFMEMSAAGVHLHG